jgi:hypothetical protein
MPAHPVSNGDTETLEAEVKGRVPTQYTVAIDAIVRQRRLTGARTSRADILREALTEYFANHPSKGAGNGEAART